VPSGDSANMAVTSVGRNGSCRHAVVWCSFLGQPIMVLFSNKDYSPIKISASLIGDPCDATKRLAEDEHVPRAAGVNVQT